MIDKEELREYLKENLLNKHEARAITGQSADGFRQSVETHKLTPFFKTGTGPGTIKLYLKEEVEAYAVQVKERRKRYK
ncbi:hypothetical protein NSQ26_14060 [Bacillus sp. FSL W7-1360]